MSSSIMPMYPLLGRCWKLGPRREVFACIKHLDRDDAALDVEIEHYAVSHLLAFGDGGVGEAHVKRVGLGIVQRLHGGSTVRRNYIMAECAVLRLRTRAVNHASPISRRISAVCSPSRGAGRSDA